MKLAVPDMISNSYFPAIAAIELGCFKQEGLDVELELIFPVDKSYAALRDGSRSISWVAPHIPRLPRSRSGKAPNCCARRGKGCTGSWSCTRTSAPSVAM